jgi:hypothetical protein
VHTLTTDRQKRIRLPDAKPGQVFAYETDGSGIHLTPVKKADPRQVKGKLVRRDGKLLLNVPDGLELAPGPIPRVAPR